MKYWYNLVTRQVEEDLSHSRKKDLLGPYPTRQAAEAALLTAAARTEAWDEEDRRRAEEDARAGGRDPGEPDDGLFGTGL